MAMKVYTITSARIDEVTANKEKLVASIENEFKRSAPLVHIQNVELPSTETEAETTRTRFAAKAEAMFARLAAKAGAELTRSRLAAEAEAEAKATCTRLAAEAEAEAEARHVKKRKVESKGQSRCQNCGESFMVEDKPDLYDRVMLFCSSECFEY